VPHTLGSFLEAIGSMCLALLSLCGVVWLILGIVIATSSDKVMTG
jgi:hypothetical protein